MYEDRYAFVVDLPDYQKLAESDNVEGMFVEDGNIDNGLSIVRKLRWVGPFQLPNNKK
jgi:hypothetical protein